MPKVAIVRSRSLLQAEKDEKNQRSSAYKYCYHQKGLEYLSQELDALRIPYVFWEEEDLDKVDLLRREDIVIVITLDMRVCAEKTFQALIRLAEEGWLVFTGRDSFFYTLFSNGKAKRFLERRVKGLFQLPPKSSVRSRRLERGHIRFSPSRFSWLTENLSRQLRYSRKLIVAVLGRSEVMASHSDIIIEEASGGSSDDDNSELEDKSVPAFIIREYPSTDGLFIYACFSPRHMANFRQILRNLWRFRTQAASQEKHQVNILKFLVVAQTLVIGLLVARALLGDSWSATVGGGIVGIVMGLLEVGATDLVKQWLSDS